MKVTINRKMFSTVMLKKMNNLFKCLTCNQILTSEESVKHKCKPTIKKHKVISASSYFTIQDEKGIVNVIIDGFDNIGYVFEIKEPNLIPLTEGLPIICEETVKEADQPKVNTNNTTDKETEPVSRFCTKHGT